MEEHTASLWETLTGDDSTDTQIAATQDQNLSTAAPLLIEDDFAAIANPSIARLKEPAQEVAQNQIPGNNLLPPEIAERPVISLQPSGRPPVTVSPLSTVHRIYSQQPQALPQTLSTERSADSPRIAAAIEQAQRAQAGLLLARLGAEKSDLAKEAGKLATAQQTQPFKAHPYLLPRGAPPQLIGRAMEQAMAQYQATMRRGGYRHPTATGTGTRPIEISV